ncbi:hypothetical protein LJR066_000619 [Acidovorax sp. LjRoot66]|uniref:hypothetical protein n=1 Tax=Acidovorax sp. LjRoot66 TaxID=3342334 RepID=UPI003ECCE442
MLTQLHMSATVQRRGGQRDWLNRIAKWPDCSKAKLHWKKHEQKSKQAGAHAQNCNGVCAFATRSECFWLVTKASKLVARGVRGRAAALQAP